MQISDVPGGSDFANGALKSEKLRLLANWIDVMDATLASVREEFPTETSVPGTDVPLVQWSVARGDEVQRELREWADQLETGPLYNTPKDPAAIKKPPS